MRRSPGEIVDYFHVLPAGVEDLEHILVVTEQLEHRGKIDPIRQRIDRRRFLLVPELHQAEQRVIGVLAHELGVDADEFAFRQPLTEIGQFLGCRNQRVYFHRRFSIGRADRRPSVRVGRLDKRMTIAC